MADGFEIAIETDPAMAALTSFGDAALKYTKPASKISADAIQAEARRRVARATGHTAEGILVREDFTGTGYIVYTEDERIDRTPIPGSTQQRSAFLAMPHVALYLEKGIRQGKPGSHTAAPRPFFFVSAQLEQAAHERRIGDALQQAADERGLGD